MFKVKFADIGEGLTEGTVTEVLVKVGDAVKMGDSLFNVETDKVSSDIPAPVDGKIAEILIKDGQEIKVGEVVVVIDDGSATVSGDDAPATEVEDNASVVGSTPVSNEVITRGAAAAPAAAPVSTNADVKASPLARKYAVEKGIDLSQVTPTGPNGRILASDIENFGGSASVAAGSAGVSFASGPKGAKIDYDNPLISVPDFNETLTFESKPMNNIRKATVKAMATSNEKVAGFTGLKNIDVTEMVKTRTQVKGYADSQRVKLTFLAFIIKASAIALKEMPNINVRNDEENKAIKFANQINIGMACDTPNGLMVPVIKGADKLSVLQIAVKINELAGKARAGKLSMNEMTGATFTVSNFGSVGLDYATPIVNYPEAAILGIGTITKTVGVIKDKMEIRDMMPFSMTADHKVIDGADAGRFLQKIEFYMQNPALLLM